MNYLFTSLVLFFTFISCQKKQIEKQAKSDDTIILKYISDHNLSANKSESGLYYIIDSVGNGIFPKQASQVRTEYKGYLIDETVFDQSDSIGVIFSLQNVIKGWSEGIRYFSEGGSGKLFIPSALAYGSKGTTGIPGNSVLIFDVKLLDVY